MVYFVSVFAYLLILAGIGIWKSRQVKSQDDFAVAGRTLSPWIMVCTMLAVWIGTGSIVGMAEQTYDTGMAALILPLGVFVGMILLSLIAAKARSIEASSVPEIIGGRFGQGARSLAVIALVIAYMVIVSYQFNAGGAVLEVITGNRVPIAIRADDVLTRDQIRRGRVVFTPEQDFKGNVSVTLHARASESWSSEDTTFTIDVVSPEEIIEARNTVKDAANSIAIKQNNYAKVILVSETELAKSYRVSSLPENGSLELIEPVLTAKKATVIAAVFIIVYTTLAGLMSLAYADILTGIVITVSMLIAFPLYWLKSGGWSGMEASFAAMADKPQHMQFWGVYSKTQLVNYLLPVFLLVLGDANQYQRIFASRSAKGARSAVTTLIFVAVAVELLIIASAWAAASMTPDPENGKYILIYAARHYMPLALGCLFMVTVVAIIISTADSFLLVPATTFMKDVYLNFINPKASERKTIFLSRMLVVLFGVIAWIVSLMFGESKGFWDKAIYAYTIYGCGITPSLVAAIAWKGATKAGAVSSILSGTIVTLVWNEAAFVKNLLPPGIKDLDAVLPAITISILCLVVVSWLTRKKTDAESAVDIH
ncbi:MAG: sodium:solute symporter family protein [Planctomycetota bacterium]|jgi:Na+/proline symporter